MNALLRFTVENFRSIAERKSISFIPDAIKDEPASNVRKENGVSYLKTSAVYGANSSGKSNLVLAMDCMASMVVHSVKVNDGEGLPHFPFALDTTSRRTPTLYEIDAVIDGTRYRYSFSNTADSICSEQLILVRGRRENALFIRNEEGIGVDLKLFPEGKDLESRTNGNRLFISLAGQLGGAVSNSIILFFQKTFKVLYGLKTDDYSNFTKRMLKDSLPGCDVMKGFFLRTGLGFKDLTVSSKPFDADGIPSNVPDAVRAAVVRDMAGKEIVNVFSVHNIYDKEGSVIGTSDFDFNEMESDGTRKLVDMAGPLFDTIRNGYIIVIDELDAKMHPLISREIVTLFNDPERNPLGAQLIFTTHDTNLLSGNFLRRDQIWFTEKDGKERTDIYSMRDILLPDGTKPRGDGNKERNYIKGRYGAVPYIQ